jgi:hypothetical protein
MPENQFQGTQLLTSKSVSYCRWHNCIQKRRERKRGSLTTSTLLHNKASSMTSTTIKLHQCYSYTLGKVLIRTTGLTVELIQANILVSMPIIHNYK